VTAAKDTAPRLPLLVIEDEPSVMTLLRSALERSGYAIVPAPSGVEGLRLLVAGEYLGIITDMRMPGGVTGADVHARSSPTAPSPPPASCSSPATW
jgi:CheY-like chemotaxis protein